MQMMKPYEPVNLFLSYTYEDEALLHRLEVHLSLLKRQHLISTWYDRKIVPGTDKAETIKAHLEQAAIILLLVSPDFMAADDSYDIEMRRALERHEAREAHVIPIILRPCSWEHASFAFLSCLPQDGKPITTWDDQDLAWKDVETGIRSIIKNFFPPMADASLSTMPTEGRKVVEENNRQKEIVVTAHRRRPRFSAPFPDIWNVPRRHTPFFTGRDPILQQLAAGFQLENEVQMIQPQAITGLGGMGKTQTAAEYAYLFRADYDAVFWVRAETQETLIADFKTITDLLELSQDRTDLIQTVHGWLKKQDSWLLIFDNADDPAIIDRFLPSATRGHVLLTTRAGAIIGQSQPLLLESLQPEDGALCILRRAGIINGSKQLHETLPANVEAAQELSQKMGGLPMALEQAGAYINDTACGVRGYLRLYERYRPQLYLHQSGAVPDYPEAVAFAWRISRSIVERSDPSASELLCLCAYLAPEGIPEQLLMLGAPVFGPVLGPVAEDLLALNLTIRLLRTYSLLNREVDRDTELTKISIHRIMQDILIDEMGEEMRQLWAERAVRAVGLALPVMGVNVLRAQIQNGLQLIAQWHMSFTEADVIRKYAEKVV